jgi:hypothetical protein
MHFHLPKPLHGWREFTGEVGIIVIGVLIALGAEALVEHWHWNHQVELSNQAFKDELLANAWNGYERLAIQPCLQGRLRDLAAQLNADNGEWQAMPERFKGAKRFYSAVLPTVYRPPTRPVFSDAWRNALADGTVNHLDHHTSQSLSSAYQSANSFAALEGEEGAIETKLSPLGSDRHLDDRTRIEMVQTIAELDRLNGLLVTETTDMFAAIRHANLGISKAEVDQTRSEVVETQRDYRGACVTAPQLDLGAR